MSWFLANLLFRLIYFPILLILKSVLFFNPKIRERMKFESKNDLEVGCTSFKKEGQKADLCFEFSSEGEYQQVASLIEDALKMGKSLELVFFSPSVEKTIVDLYGRFPRQVRYFRYPILGISFSSWITSSTLILVRYDLFPEFLVWSLKPGHKLKLVWVTFKKERLQNKTISLFKRAFLMGSSSTVFATESDAELGRKMGFAGPVYDFRMEQIKRRIEAKAAKFEKIFPQYPKLKTLIDQYPRQKRLIFGNAWAIDLDLLKNVPSDYLLVVVPHQLKPEILSQMQSTLSTFGRTPSMISDQQEVKALTSTILINKKGILCELYADFGKAYVGGGFGVSVHSLLEPLVAGSEHLSCGPVNHRSTEFDLAQSYGHMSELKSPQDFERWLMEDISQAQLHDRLKGQLDAYPRFQKEILSC